MVTTKEKYEFASSKLKDFKNFIEIVDFRRFLLLTLNLESAGPEAILAQMGMGSKGKAILPYDPEKKILYQKIQSGLSMSDQLTLYVKTKEAPTELVHKTESKIFEKYLTPFERKNLLSSKYMLITPKVIDYSANAYTTESSPKPSHPAVESMYLSLVEFIAAQNLKYLFFLEGTGTDPDLIFVINMSFDPTHSSPNLIQFFDVFVDTEHQLRGKTYIKITEKLDISFLTEIKETSSSEMFNSNFTIIVPVKSFNTP